MAASARLSQKEVYKHWSPNKGFSSFICISAWATVEHSSSNTFCSIVEVCSGNTMREKIMLCLTALPYLSLFILKA